MGWNYLSIPKLQRLHRWSLGMDKSFHPMHYNGCNYLSMLGLKLNHVSKRGPRWSVMLWQQPVFFFKNWCGIRVIWCQLWHVMISKDSFDRGHNAGSFCLYAQSMRGDLTLQRHLSLTESITRMIPDALVPNRQQAIASTNEDPVTGA